MKTSIAHLRAGRTEMAGTYPRVFTRALDAMLVADDDGRLIDANPRACELFGASKDDMLRWTVFDLCLPEKADSIREQWPGFLIAGAVRGEDTLRRPDGTTFYGEFSGTAHFMPGKHLSIIRDISARKELEHQLRLSEQRLSRAQRIARIGSWEWDIAKDEILWSDECFRIFGLEPSPETKTYEQFLTHLHPEDRPRLRKATEDALLGASPFSLEYRILHPNGVERVVHAEADVIRDAQARPEHMCGTVQDISERRKLEAQREQLVHALQEQERLRQEWTSVVAHDLRQPVTTILTLAMMLERSTDDPKVYARSERIVGSAQRLNRMIDDLSDLSRIEAHRIELLPVATNMPALLVRVADASEARERIAVSVRGEVPLLLVDPQRIEQIVENLLSNALKYGTPGTPIEVIAQRVGDEVAIQVRNQGPGIAPEDLPKLFERFQRGRNHGGAIKGLGLGLYIVRGLVEAHGGRIEVHSVPGATTTFTFWLPIDAAAECSAA